jgi:hypothetical protein
MPIPTTPTVTIGGPRDYPTDAESQDLARWFGCCGSSPSGVGISNMQGEKARDGFPAGLVESLRADLRHGAAWSPCRCSLVPGALGMMLLPGIEKRSECTVTEFLGGNEATVKDDRSVCHLERFDGKAVQVLVGLFGISRNRNFERSNQNRFQFMIERIVRHPPRNHWLHPQDLIVIVLFHIRDKGDEKDLSRCRGDHVVDGFIFHAFVS